MAITQSSIRLQFKRTRASVAFCISNLCELRPYLGGSHSEYITWGSKWEG
jgi:hypothetical protein